MEWEKIKTLRLRNAPLAFKCFALGYVTAISLGYLYALGNIALVVGLTPKDIAIHYYGSTTRMGEAGTASTTSQGEESLNLDQLEATPVAPVAGPRPSFKALVGEGHFHLFGMSSFFFGLGLLALFTGLSERVKSWLVGGVFLFIILDNVSFMATRFLGPKFAIFTAISGGVMGLCFSALWFSIVLELLKKKEGI